MDQHRQWDEEYRAKGRLWTGVAKDVPSFSEGSRVLELGCGDGKTLMALARQDLGALIGLDSSRAGLDICTAIDRKGVLTVPHLVLGDATALPFEDGAFDAVMAHHVLDHMLADGRTKAVSEAVRVMRKGGRISFKGFSVKDMRAGKGEEVEENTYQRGNGLLYHYFSVDEVMELFAGLEVVDLRERVWDMGGKEGLRRHYIVALLVRTG
jgi:ubiquinone/menaquinone biosynthesis C-methylase UbiE